ncbi:MAG TPA: response regulator transcription factor [Deltaproteobacteria bacterium]|nr:response regulator transcription factor [Deltaproteobacteria bacterium]
MGGFIAVVDDEPDIVELVSIHLRKAGLTVKGFPDGDSLLRSLPAGHPDLIILDLMLPGLDGFEICRILRRNEQYARIPIIMLTAKDHEADKVEGLEIGADDYVTKPFSPKELIARVKAVLRRSEPGKTDFISIGDSIVIDPERFEVKVEGETITLTPVEFKILHLLAQSPGKVFTRDRILDHLWGNEKAVLDRTVDVHIKNLRDKLGDSGDIIRNVRGVGYKLQA